MDASDYVDEKRTIEVETVGPRESFDLRPHIQIQTKIMRDTDRHMFYLSLFGEKAIWDYIAELKKAIETVEDRMSVWGDSKGGDENEDVETQPEAGEGNSVALTE